METSSISQASGEITSGSIRLTSGTSWKRALELAAPKKPVVKKFLRATSYYGQKAVMDSQGRLLLPLGLRESRPARR